MISGMDIWCVTQSAANGDLPCSYRISLFLGELSAN